MSERDDVFIKAVEKAIRWGGSIGRFDGSDAFNIAAGHVGILLEDAFDCFERGSFGTAVFLSITALEETAKAELLGHRARGSDGEKNKGRDPMRDHAHKHRIAVRPTTFVGRLPDILGAEACDRLHQEAIDGDLYRLRETALYIQADETGVHAPATEISAERAREIILLALKSADDILVGYTNYSYELGKTFELLIGRMT